MLMDIYSESYYQDIFFRLIKVKCLQFDVIINMEIIRNLEYNFYF